MVRKSRSVATALAVVLALAVSGCSISDFVNRYGEQPQRDSSGTITGTASAHVFTLKVGDCVGSADDGAEVAELPAMACDEPHQMEIFASAELPDGEYPGVKAVEAQAEAECLAERFEAFTGATYEESDLDVTYLMPTDVTWTLGDRGILCLIYRVDEKGAPVTVTGSLRSAHRSATLSEK